MTDKDKKKPWYSFITMTDILIYAGALANISLWTQSGLMTESASPLGVISAAALGVLMSFAPVQIVIKWAGMEPVIKRKQRGRDEYDERPNPKYWTAIVSFGAILALEIALLGPVVVALMTGATLAATLGGASWAWAFGRVAASAVALAGLAAVTGVHAPQGATGTTAQGAQPAESAPKSEPKPQPAPVPAPQSEPARRMVQCTEPGCGMEYAWPNGKGAHYKKHHAPVAIDQSLLIKKDGTK